MGLNAFRYLRNLERQKDYDDLIVKYSERLVKFFKEKNSNISANYYMLLLYTFSPKYYKIFVDEMEKIGENTTDIWTRITQFLMSTNSLFSSFVFNLYIPSEAIEKTQQIGTLCLIELSNHLSIEIKRDICIEFYNVCNMLISYRSLNELIRDMYSYEDINMSRIYIGNCECFYQFITTFWIFLTYSVWKTMYFFHFMQKPE